MIQGLAPQLNGRLDLESRVGQGTAAAAHPAGRRRPDLDQHRRQARGPGPRRDPARSGAEALVQLQRDPAFDLTITDFSMPKMNGGRLAVAARAMRPEPPMLLATGYAGLPGDVDLKLPQLSKPYPQRQMRPRADRGTDPRRP